MNDADNQQAPTRKEHHMDEPYAGGAAATAGYASPKLVEDRYAEVRGAISRLDSQIASVEIATHELAARLNPILRLDTPQASNTTGPEVSSSGVEIADGIEHLAGRVNAIDSFLRNIEGRVAL